MAYRDELEASYERNNQLEYDIGLLKEELARLKGKKEKKSVWQGFERGGVACVLLIILILPFIGLAFRNTSHRWVASLDIVLGVFLGLLIAAYNAGLTCALPLIVMLLVFMYIGGFVALLIAIDLNLKLPLIRNK